MSAAELGRVAQWLASHPNLASRAWIYTQYDRMVGASTIGSAGEVAYAAALVRLPGQDRALAISLDGNPFWVEAEPRTGAALLVSEAARNVACTGARPLGLTNGLNFGSPLDPEVYYTFVEVIEGMREACTYFGLPVTGGNVSFYNQDERGPVLPTPMIGVVGLLERALERAIPLGWPRKGGPFQLLLIGGAEAIHAPTLGASHYLRDWVGVRYSPAPRLDLKAELTLQRLLPELSERGYILAAHGCVGWRPSSRPPGNGLGSGSGFVVEKPAGVRRDAFWFGEDRRPRGNSYPSQSDKSCCEAQIRRDWRYCLAGETLPGQATPS